MADKPRPPAKIRKNETKKLNYAAIKTLAANGFNDEEISNTIGNAEGYIRSRKLKDPQLVQAIKEGRDLRNNGIDYEVIEQLAAQGCTQEQISLALGMGAHFISHQKEKDEKLVLALESGTAKGIVKITGALFNKGVNGDLGAMIFYLKNKAGWKDRVDMEATVNNYYMEGRKEAKDIDTWSQQYNPTSPSQTRQ
jgi:hypothetical protein